MQFNMKSRRRYVNEHSDTFPTEVERAHYLMLLLIEFMLWAALLQLTRQWVEIN